MALSCIFENVPIILPSKYTTLNCEVYIPDRFVHSLLPVFFGFIFSHTVFFLLGDLIDLFSLLLFLCSYTLLA